MKYLSRNTVCVIHLLKNVTWLNNLTNLKSCKAYSSRCKVWACGCSLLGMWVRNPARQGCLPLVSVLFCQVEVSATSWPLVQRSPIECGVSEFDREVSVLRKTWSNGECFAMCYSLKWNYIFYVQPQYTSLGQIYVAYRYKIHRQLCLIAICGSNNCLNTTARLLSRPSNTVIPRLTSDPANEFFG